MLLTNHLPNRLSITSRGVYIALFYVIFFTSSFDIFLNLRLGGFSFRFCYLSILILALLNLEKMPRFFSNSNAVPGLVPLLAWTLFLVGFAGNTGFLARNIGYLTWHFIHLLFIIITVNSFSSRETFIKLLRAYLLSFVFVAAFGLLQFCLGLAGIELLLRLWWLPGIPRINGFSYEPSFFGSYLVLGWVLLFIFSVNKFTVLPVRLTRACLALVSLCLLLSSSRMSLLVIIVFLVGYSAIAGVKGFYTLQLKRAQIGVIAATGMSFLLAGGVAWKHFDRIAYVFTGLGIAGQSDHSAGYRLDTMEETWRVFRDSPIIGVSLGGVASRIAENHGEEPTSNEVVREYEGINIFVEVLAASGIIGFAFFLWYLFELFHRPLRQASDLREKDPEMALILRGFALALAVELGILAMNQNILRPFLWVHIAFLSLACAVAGRVWASNPTAKEGIP